MAEEEKVPSTIYLPPNVLKTKGLFGIPYRRWIEALFADIMAVLIVSFIPLVKSSKIMLMLICVAGISFVFVRGIKNRSVLQIMFALIRFKRRKRRLHLATPNYVRRIIYEEAENESFAEHVAKLIKERTNEFIDQYSTTDNSESRKKNS